MPRVQESANFSQTVCGIEECRKLIPVFNPSELNGMCAADWLLNIDTVKNMFKWNDTSTLFYAALRLEEAAASWFTAIKHDRLTWTDFKTSLLQAFPASSDASRIYVQLMQRTKKEDESIGKYFYDVLALARQGGFDDNAAKNFIVSGLNDTELISSIAGLVPNCSTTHEVDVNNAGWPSCKAYICTAAYACVV